MTEFFEMGGYAGFVWASYCVTALSLIVLAFVSYKRMKNLRKQAEALRANRRKTQE